MHPRCPTPLVLLIFNLPCQLWGVIPFEWVISLCWNFENNLISYTPFIWKSFIRIWDGPCSNLWNFAPFDLEWPEIDFRSLIAIGSKKSYNEWINHVYVTLITLYLNVLFRAYNLIRKRITRSAIIVEVNTKDLNLVKINISSLHSL